MRRKALTLLSLLAAAALAAIYFDLPADLLKRTVYMDDIEACAREYRLDPLFVTAMVKTESNFSRSARSHRGAVGLMQLLPSTAKEVSRELGYRHFSAGDLEVPEINIRLGTHYLSRLMKEFDNNEVLALAAYNAGKNKVQRWYRDDPRLGTEISRIPYRETRNYVTRVQRTYEWLKKIRHIRQVLRRKKG